MGYTHYMSDKRAFTDKEWKRFQDGVRAIVARHSGLLANGMGDEGTKPEIASDYISFNGIGDDSCETCFINRETEEFSFCKTDEKPYDVAVVEVFRLTRDILGRNGVQISSDGGDKVFDLPTPRPKPEKRK